MILFFKTQKETVIATEVNDQLNDDEMAKLAWLYGDATLMDTQELEGFYVGPRREMVTPWSTNAVEITQNMNLNGILPRGQPKRRPRPHAATHVRGYWPRSVLR